MAHVEHSEVACPHAIACGGCPLISLPYPEQLVRKGGRVTRALAHFPLLARVPIASVLAAQPVVSYRSRTKLVVGPSGVGLYGTGGHELVDLPGCRVLPPELATVVARLRAYVRAGEVPVHIEGGATGLRGLDLRGSAPEGAVLVTLIVDEEPGAKDRWRSIAERLRADESSVAGVFMAPHAGDNPRLLAPGASLLAGAARIEDRVGETRYVAGPGAFVQAHRGQAARVHAAVARHAVLHPGSRVLDLFAGGGGIGLAMARAGARVTLVESHAPAAADARESATLNGLEVEVLTLDAESAVEQLLEKRARYDTVVVNPPRRGLTPALRRGIALLGPERVAYISCDPETLARDLDHLRRLGYATRSLQPVDMIPLTDEIETVALLTQAPSPHPAVLYEDEDLLVVDKWPDEPVQPRKGAGPSTLERVRGRAAWAKAIALDAPDDGASGICTFVRSPARLAAWRAALPRVALVAMVRGITHEGGVLRGAGGPPMRHARVGTAAGQSVIAITGIGATAQAARRDLAGVEHPVVGDTRHGHAPTNRHAAERLALTRPFLHVARMERNDPRTGNVLTFEAPLAPDLVLVLGRAGAAGLVDAAAASARAVGVTTSRG